MPTTCDTVMHESILTPTPPHPPPRGKVGICFCQLPKIGKSPHTREPISHQNSTNSPIPGAVHFQF